MVGDSDFTFAIVVGLSCVWARCGKPSDGRGQGVASQVMMAIGEASSRARVVV